MNSLSFQLNKQVLVRQNVYILIKNQLLSTTNAKDVNIGREGDWQRKKRVRTWAGLDVFRIFCILVKMRSLDELRLVS